MIMELNYYNLLFLHFLLLFLLPLPTMAMKKGEGLRKGDAHGVPGKTMLNGDRPVPLPPGTNAAPKVQSILPTSGREQRVPSLLVNPNGADNKVRKGNSGVPSLLDQLDKNAPRKVESLLNKTAASGRKERARSLLLDPPKTPVEKNVTEFLQMSINKGKELLGSNKTEYLNLSAGIDRGKELLASSIKEVSNMVQNAVGNRDQREIFDPRFQSEAVLHFIHFIISFISNGQLRDNFKFAPPFYQAMARVGVDPRLISLFKRIATNFIDRQPGDNRKFLLSCWTLLAMVEMLHGNVLEEATEQMTNPEMEQLTASLCTKMDNVVLGPGEDFAFSAVEQYILSEMAQTFNLNLLYPYNIGPRYDLSMKTRTSSTKPQIEDALPKVNTEYLAMPREKGKTEYLAMPREKGKTEYLAMPREKGKTEYLAMPRDNSKTEYLAISLLDDPNPRKKGSGSSKGPVKSLLSNE